MPRRRKLRDPVELDLRGRVTPKILRRFTDKLRIDGNCWRWTGGTDSNGYPQFWFEGMAIGAHRFSVALFHGLLRDGEHAHHRCENHDCVNPAHVEAKDALENAIDGTQRKKEKCGVLSCV